MAQGIVTAFDISCMRQKKRNKLEFGVVTVPLTRAPRHVALIMEGNERWSAARGVPYVEGYRRGVEALRSTLCAAIELGVSFLTVCPFSTEDQVVPQYDDPPLSDFIRNITEDAQKYNVCIKIIGQRAWLAAATATLFEKAEQATLANTGLTLVIAFGYGARQEIVSATRLLVKKMLAGRLQLADIDPDAISAHLETGDIPDPDLIIRTSSQKRLSNFLLWQAAYAEFVFLPIDWPDFDKSAFEAAIIDFNRRERRFGRAPKKILTGSDADLR